MLTNGQSPTLTDLPAILFSGVTHPINISVEESPDQCNSVNSLGSQVLSCDTYLSSSKLLRAKRISVEERSSNPMSFPLCKFYNSLQGCRFGNKCRYRHSNSFSPTLNYLPGEHHHDVRQVKSEHQPKASPPTHHIQEAYLQNDKASVNSTPLPEARFSKSFYSEGKSCQDEAPVNTDQLETTEFSIQAEQESKHSDQQDDSAVSSDKKQQWKTARRPCHYFTKYGNCHYENRCRFEHVRSQRLPPRFQEQQKDPATFGDCRDGITNASQNAEGNRSTTKGEWLKDNSRGEESVTSSDTTRGPSLQDETLPGGDEEGEDDAGADQRCRTGKDSRNKRGGQERPGRVCQFYLSGRCWRGQRCKFLHPKYDYNTGSSAPEDVTQQLEETITGSNKTTRGKAPARSISQKATPAKLSPVQQKAPYIPQGVKKWKREEVDDVEAARLRRTEIDQLQKRFPKSKMQVKKDSQELFDCVVSFTPTDPDWPFDVKTFDLQVTIPSEYPLQMLSISLPREQDLPETVRRYVEVSIEEWLEEKRGELEEKSQLMLVFRPFLRWLDRHIEDVVTDALRQLKRELVAKSAGLEFISAKELQKQYPGRGDDDEEEDEDSDNEDDTENSQSSNTEGEDDSLTDSEYDEEGSEGNDESTENHSECNQARIDKQEKLKAMLADPERKGTEVSLKNMQLRESAASLYFDKICLVIQCDRCKSTAEFLTSGGRVNVVQCGKCGQTQIAKFRPSLGHQFSATIGFLDLDACLPFDVILQNCSTIVTCLSCNKDTKMGAVLPGQPQDHWCRSCHRKLKVITEGVRFTQLGPSNAAQELKGSVRVVVPRQRRVPKDPAIQEGKPLPNFGTCKHYKKSYRWLRFPCCGKCYPCDICHDIKEDHEMKLANRMICGFCCKEQVYAADKPCKGCDLNLTKVHTQHWEDGQGCRDKISMSRNDKQKHRNMTKTVSKHAQKVKDMQSKKKTKLRHA